MLAQLAVPWRHPRGRPALLGTNASLWSLLWVLSWIQSFTFVVEVQQEPGGLGKVPAHPLSSSSSSSTTTRSSRPFTSTPSRTSTPGTPTTSLWMTASTSWACRTTDCRTLTMTSCRTATGASTECAGCWRGGSRQAWESHLILAHTMEEATVCRSLVRWRTSHRVRCWCHVGGPHAVPGPAQLVPQALAAAAAAQVLPWRIQTPRRATFQRN